jgi:hypothetical protein
MHHYFSTNRYILSLFKSKGIFTSLFKCIDFFDTIDTNDVYMYSFTFGSISCAINYVDTAMQSSNLVHPIKIQRDSYFIFNPFHMKHNSYFTFNAFHLNGNHR